MGVFRKNSDGGFTEIDEKKVMGHEKEELEELIFNNSDIFPVHQIADSDTWIPLVRQLHIKHHGSLDILATDKDGTIYIVECKLKKNTNDMKTIRGQITDYVAGLWKERDSWDTFLEKIQKKSNKKLKEILKVEPDFDVESTLQSIKQNFEAGKYCLVYAVDRINPGLRNVVDWHNDGVDLDHNYPAFALEVKKYSGNDNSEFIVVQTYPHDLGEIKRKKEVETIVNKEEDWMKKFNSTELDDAQKSEILKFQNEIKSLAENNDGEIGWGRGIMPSMLPKFSTTITRSAIGLKPNGNLILQLGLLGGDYPEVREKFIAKIFEIEEIKSIVQNSKLWKSHASDSTNWHRGDFAIEPKMWLPHKEKILEIMKEIFVEST